MSAVLTNGLQLVTKRLWNFLHIYCKLSLRGDESEFRGTAAEVKRREKDVQGRISWGNECI